MTQTTENIFNTHYIAEQNNNLTMDLPQDLQ